MVSGANAVGSGKPERASASVDEYEMKGSKGLVGGTATPLTREERLRNTDHRFCKCRKCDGTNDL